MRLGKNKIHLLQPWFSQEVCNDIRQSSDIKPLACEKEVSYISYVREINLGKVVNFIKLKSVLSKYTDDRRLAAALKNLVIFGTL